MTRIVADLAAFTTAQHAWQDAKDGLDGAWRRLAVGRSADLAPEAAAAVNDFRERWTHQVKTSAGVAERHHDTLEQAMGGYQVADEQTRDTLRNLLAWEHRGADVDWQAQPGAPR